MKKIVLVLLSAFAVGCLVSCSAGKGCPSNGKNLGAEKLISGDKKTMKLAKKAGKFKQGKF
jgi:hypothetical protein